MNLVADESVDRPIVERLRRQGHDVIYIAELEPSITDDAVLDHANQRRAVLLTGDKDFGELVFRQGRISTGVILLRLAGIATETKAGIVAAAIREHATEMEGVFSVISPGAVRIRRS